MKYGLQLQYTPSIAVVGTGDWRFETDFSLDLGPIATCASHGTWYPGTSF